MPAISDEALGVISVINMAADSVNQQPPQQ